MNNKRLTQLYNHLKPRERFPLIVAASVRGDAVETERLMHSAAPHHFAVPDYHGIDEGFTLLTLLHSIEMLDLAVKYERFSTMLANQTAYPAGKKGKELDKRLFADLKLCAYLITAQADAWKQFCAELGIDHEPPLKDQTWYETIRQAEELARGLAFTADAATAYLRRVSGNESAEVVTAAQRCQDMKERLQSRMEVWS